MALSLNLMVALQYTAHNLHGITVTNCAVSVATDLVYHIIVDDLMVEKGILIRKREREN